ncbi:MAG: DUF4291 family protein [Sphingobacteriales bacterium]|nr:MAG: DUF4291 family protein [Sphingobacteriales bacterium]
MLLLESYEEHEHHLPQSGKFIIAQFDKESIIVYQAFKDSIAKYAVENQKFGGEDYDFNRVTRLKPSFLWMMYYSGWAKKEDQENVLAIRISRKGFDEILKTAVMAGSKQTAGGDIELKWEPYYDLHGNKSERKAAKLVLKGGMLQRYNNEYLIEIQNITPFVKEQQQLLLAHKEHALKMPRERAYAPNDLTILPKLNATTISL